MAAPNSHALLLHTSGARTLHLLLFTGVTNVTELRARVLAKALDVALLDARLVASPFCVHVAASKALVAAASGRTKGVAASLHADVIHCLHGGRNVGEALRALGVRVDATVDVLAVVIDAGEGIAGLEGAEGGRGAGPPLAALTALIHGTPASLSDYYGVRFEGIADRGGAGSAVVCAPAGAADAPGARVDVAAIAGIYKLAPQEVGATLAALEGSIVNRVALGGL